MMIMIKSAPDTPESKRAMTLARDLAADLVLIQNGVYLAQATAASHGTDVYALDEDLRMRGIGDEANIGAVKRIGYDTLVDLIVQADQVRGAF